ncbi:MAG: hypothetical protein IPO24_14975 [Bacteroidetes bacterium]|nr:hypothetical protein [Bacteroidota bacterium]
MDAIILYLSEQGNYEILTFHHRAIAIHQHFTLHSRIITAFLMDLLVNTSSGNF